MMYDFDYDVNQYMIVVILKQTNRHYDSNIKYVDDIVISPRRSEVVYTTPKQYQ